MFYVHYPIAMTIDADTFNKAAKKFVKMNRNFNIGQLIMSDQMNNYKKALIRNYVVNGMPKARISFSSYNTMPTNMATNIPPLAVQTNNLAVPLMAPGLLNTYSPNVVGDPANYPFIMSLD